MSYPYEYPFEYPTAIIDFGIAFSGTQSADGKVFELVDESNYGTLYDLSDFSSRYFVVRDYLDNILATLPLVDEQLIAKYNVPKDQYIKATLYLEGVNSYELTHEYPLDRITATKYQKALQGGCGCNKSKSQALQQATEFLIGAQYAAPTENHAIFQSNIDTANTFLDTIV